MKLKSAVLLTAFSTLFLTAGANAGMLIDPYLGVTVGAGGAAIFLQDQTVTENAQSYGAVIGMDIPLFRIEAEYDYLNNNVLFMNTGMVNAYFKIPSAVIHPYIGVGAGIAFDGERKELSSIKTKDDMIYQGMLGLTFDLPVIPFNIDAEARVLYFPDAYTAVAGNEPDILHYDLRLKLRYVF